MKFDVKIICYFIISLLAYGRVPKDFPHFYYMLGAKLSSLLYGDVAVITIVLSTAHARFIVSISKTSNALVGQ